MTRPDRDDRALAALDALIDEITVDALGDDEQFWAFRQAFENNIVVPVDGFVIGEPVSVISFEYDGNERRGLTAKCRRADGAEHVVAACDKDTAARCRLLASDRVITLRASGVWHIVPGEIVVVKPRKQWKYAGHPYLSGEIASTRLDVTSLGLVPLRLEDRGIWEPDEEYWSEEGERIEDWAKPIIARGPRQEFEMEQVLPGADPADPDSDPITESNELKDGGDFDYRPAEAIRHYEVGLRIGELSLGDQFDGVLPWGHIDNRPFLRCMHGFGLCCWRLGRFEEAGRVFNRMLWLNPSDNQGVRFLIDPVRARAALEGRPHQ